MCPPAAPPLDDIGIDCTYEHIFSSLNKIASGWPLPRDVITDVNPYKYVPSNLPDGIWYLIHPEENEDTELGCWNATGEACQLFSNSVFSGWRTTLEFFEGQVPHQRKTNWVMQEYWIAQTGAGENSKVKEARSLCRVFLGYDQGLDPEKQQKVASPHIASATPFHSAQSVLERAQNDTSNGSTSKHEVDEDNETGILAVTGRLLAENPPAIDYFSRGDYLELLDLHNPASPSSSSDNSSCLTMSSDEYFDSLALLRDLESQSNQDLVQKEDGCKFSVSASVRPNEVVVFPASPGSFISIEGSMPPNAEIQRPVAPTHGSVNGSRDLDCKGVQHAARNQKRDFRNEGPLSNSHDVGTSSTNRLASRNGKEKAAKDRKKKPRKKYLCFMPFYFLF